MQLQPVGVILEVDVQHFFYHYYILILHHYHNQCKIQLIQNIINYQSLQNYKVAKSVTIRLLMINQLYQFKYIIISINLSLTNELFASRIKY